MQSRLLVLEYLLLTFGESLCLETTLIQSKCTYLVNKYLQVIQRVKRRQPNNNQNVFIWRKSWTP